MTVAPLISVVIPAFNSAATLQDTLHSVAAQTHRNLEIIVVDDGSTDETAHVAQSFCRRDPRARLIQKANGGVASARNAGVDSGTGDYVAFIDADDLWHPAKLAKQLALLEQSGKETALVYSPFRRINAEGMVIDSSRNHRVDGWVINRHFFVNPIGNGSSILIRRQVLQEVGGYSSVLRECGAQGCEDLLLQLRVALRYRYATVPEYLVGYRQIPGNMSSDEERMLRSTLLALNMVLAESPHAVALLKNGLFGRKIWEYLKVTVERRNFRRGLAFIRPYLKGRIMTVVQAAGDDAATKLRRLAELSAAALQLDIWMKRNRPLRHFYEYDPADMNYADHLPMTATREATDRIHAGLRALAHLDAVYLPEQSFGLSGFSLDSRTEKPGLGPRRSEVT